MFAISVTVKDLLCLPSLNSAKVIAGHQGLSRIVSSISVLEYAQPSMLQDELFHNNEFYGSEIVITAFINIKDDINAQLKTIQRLHEAGEVGLILYYVGIFLPSVDPSVIQLADTLGFTLICMPENRMNLRYSEVIYEVMEAILKAQMADTYLVGEMLERISSLPPAHRSMDSVLRMLSDKLTSSLYLIDRDSKAVNYAAWPKTGNLSLQEVLDFHRKHCHNMPDHLQTVTIGGLNFYLYGDEFMNSNSASLYLLILKENGLISSNICQQAREVIQLFIGIWSQGHGDIGQEELMKAILNDEPVKMRRLAEILHTDVRSIRHMLLILPTHPLSAEKLAFFHQTALACASRLLDQHYSVGIQGLYEKDLILFTGDETIRESRELVIELLRQELERYGGACFVCCRGLTNTADVRDAYLLYLSAYPQARIIYPRKYVLTMQELRFVQHCQTLLEQGEAVVERRLALINLIAAHHTDLYQTLETYLLDADMSITHTAEQLYVHKNTIKYRINRLNQLCQCPIHKMPETYELYQAVALNRLLASSSGRSLS